MRTICKIANAIAINPIAKMSYCPFPTGPKKKNMMLNTPAAIHRGGRRIGYSFLIISFICVNLNTSIYF